MPRTSVVLIGPVVAGKSVVGERLAEALGRNFIELDEIAGDYYEEVDWRFTRNDLAAR